MFRRATAAIAMSALAFAGVAADGESGASASLTDVSVEVVDGVVTATATPTFAGGEPIIVTEDGVDGSPGFDIVSATLFQDGEDIIATMEISGAFSPGAQYLFPLGATGQGDNQLLAYANTTADFDFQLANFDDGYTSTEVAGSVDGSTITWILPLSILGVSGGAKITAGAEPLHTALGVSNPSVGSVNFGCCIEIDTADWTAPTYTLGGGMVMTITGNGVEEVVKAKVRRGVAVASFADLAPGTYTVELSTTFADATDTQTFTVTV